MAEVVQPFLIRTGRDGLIREEFWAGKCEVAEEEFVDSPDAAQQRRHEKSGSFDTETLSHGVIQIRTYDLAKKGCGSLVHSFCSRIHIGFHILVSGFCWLRNRFLIFFRPFDQLGYKMQAIRPSCFAALQRRKWDLQVVTEVAMENTNSTLLHIAEFPLLLVVDDAQDFQGSIPQRMEKISVENLSSFAIARVEEVHSSNSFHVTFRIPWLCLRLTKENFRVHGSSADVSGVVLSCDGE